MSNHLRGQLAIVGGEEDKTGECKILREFVRRAGGLKARVLVMTAARELPRETAREYIEVFDRLGVAEVRTIDTICREDTNSSTTLQALEKATGVFLVASNQARITGILKGTALEAAIHKRFSEGLVVAGTSAGAAVMSEIAIVEGESETHPRVEVVEIGPGLGLLPGVAIDQHFSQCGRLGRLVSAMLQQPVNLGFGIDENTAIFINGSELEVFGEGSVTAIDLSEISHCNLTEVLKDEALTLCGAKLHILSEGYGFDLKTRKPLLKKTSLQAA